MMPTVNDRPLTSQECFDAALAWEHLLDDPRYKRLPAATNIIRIRMSEWLIRSVAADDNGGIEP